MNSKVFNFYAKHRLFGSLALLGSLAFVSPLQASLENPQNQYTCGNNQTCWEENKDFVNGHDFQTLYDYTNYGSLTTQRYIGEWWNSGGVYNFNGVSHSITLNRVSVRNGYFNATNQSLQKLSISSLETLNETLNTNKLYVYAVDISNGSYLYDNTNNQNKLTLTGSWSIISNAVSNNTASISNLTDLDFKGALTMRTSAAGGTSLTVSNISNTAHFGNITLKLLSAGDIGSNNLDLAGISGKLTIDNLAATRGNISLNSNAEIKILNIATADFNPTTTFNLKDNSHLNIGTLRVFGGWGATTKASVQFKNTNTNNQIQLDINKAVLSDWSTLDAGWVNGNVTINELQANYATLKANGNLTIKKANFSVGSGLAGNVLHLYAGSNGTVKIDNFTMQQGADLRIHSGKTLQADHLTMSNGAVIVAQEGNPATTDKGGLSGDTIIDHIDFDGSTLYVNNLTTNNITIKNNASIELKKDKSGLYTNKGDLNISDGSKLMVSGNMSNEGNLNLTLNSNGSALKGNALIQTTGYFQFNLDAPASDAQDSQDTKSKINIYTSASNLKTGIQYTIIEAAGGIQFQQNGKTYTNANQASSDYNALLNSFQQSVSFFDATDRTKPLDISLDANIQNSNSKQILSFALKADSVYVDITPSINPGTWVFGLGGAAAFGSMGGAGGLARDYTLTLEKKTATDPIDNQTKPVIYYLQGYDYHNWANMGAVFTIDATGSKFILGKDRDTLGDTGTITIGQAMARSTMLIKATDIYLGGNITLGDGALISGHLQLHAKQGDGGYIGIGEDSNAKNYSINVRNHSSLSASGDVFDYGGTINIGGNGTVSDEVTLDLSQITGQQKITKDGREYSIFIHKLITRDARKNALGGGISAKDFYIDAMEVRSSNISYNEFLTDIGNSTIKSLTFKAGTSDADSSTLQFNGGNLEIGALDLQNYGRFYAQTLKDVKVTDSLSSVNSILQFSDQSQEVYLKNIILFENTQLTTKHFDSYNLSISHGDSTSSFYQSPDDGSGYATMALKGDYAVFSDAGHLTSRLVFNDLNELTADGLSARTWGAWGSSITLDHVKKATIQSLKLYQNSDLDVVRPAFDSSTSQDAALNIHQISLNRANFTTAGTGSLTSDSISMRDSAFNVANLIVNQDLGYTSDSKITIHGDLTLKNTLSLYLAGSSLNTIRVDGRTDIYFTDSATGNTVSSYVPVFRIYNLEQLKGIKAGTEYTILDSNKGITYHFITSQSSSSGADSGYQSNMKDRIGFYEGSDPASERTDKGWDFLYNGLQINKIVTDTTIGFKITDPIACSGNYCNMDRIEYYFYRKGGQEWLDAIHAVGKDVMEYYQVLMLDKNNPLWANGIILREDLNYFTKIAERMQSAADQIGSPSRKASTLDALRLATDVNKNNRLVRLSSTKSSEDTAFARMIEKYKNTRFAAASNVASDAASQRGKTQAKDQEPSTLDIAQAYAQTIRDIYKNNIWATAIGVANFVQNGNAALYGINAGYDRAFKVGDNRVIVGGYLAYAYSTYNGDLIQNNANNLNVGIYVRSFIPRGEIDFSASETIGLNNEFINSQEIITRQLNQNYTYQSYITNINLNYGYLFYLQDKSMVLKPQLGLSYFYIANSKIQGLGSNAFYSDAWAKANADSKNVLALNIALEARKYISEGSYWYVLGGVSQDLLVKSPGDETIRFVRQNTLIYQKGDNAVNLRFLLSIGGEMEIFERTYLNLGLGSKLGVFYKDIGISGNVGVRYVF